MLRNFVKALAVVTLLAGIPSCSMAEVTNLASPTIGQSAPAFSLKDSTGKQHSLSDYKGKLVVLEWVNYDCPFVKKHYGSGNMQKLQKTYTDKGVIWFSVNS